MNAYLQPQKSRPDPSPMALPTTDAPQRPLPAGGGRRVNALRSYWRSRVASASAARRSVDAPATWRLWIAALWVVVSLQISAYAPLLFGSLGFFLTWERLKQTATSYASPAVERSARRRRRVEFASLLTMQGAFAVLSLASLDSLVRTTAHRTPALMLSATAMGAWIFYGMLRTWWRPTYALGGAFAGVGGIVAGLLLAGDAWTGPTMGRLAWLAWIVRLSLIFSAGFVLVEALRPVDERRSPWVGMAQNYFETPVFVLLVGLMVRPPASLGDADGGTLSLWILSAAAVTIAVALAAPRVLFPAALDWRRIRRATAQGELSLRALPDGWLVAACLSPALVAVSLTGWTAWCILWAFGVGSALIAAMDPFVGKRTSVERKSAMLHV
jgi:uncharacterized membrane protein